MLETIFIVLIILAFTFFSVGVLTGSIVYLKETKWVIKRGVSIISLWIAALLFIFIALSSMNIEKQYCENQKDLTRETYIYGDNYSGYHWDYTDNPPPPSFRDVNLFHRNTSTAVNNFYCHTEQYEDFAMAMFFGVMVLMSLMFILYYAMLGFKDGY